MTEPLCPTDAATTAPVPNLEAVLGAWHTATVRLEKTHEMLREEVRHLTDELAVKNRELARKNRLADLGQMASHIAHEVRNNLVPVALYMSLLRRRISDNRECLEILAKIESGFTSLDATVNDLLNFTSDRDPRACPFPLRKLIEDVLGSLTPQLAAQSIKTVVAIAREQLIAADRDMMRRAVLNLVLNALDAMPDGGTLTVTSSVDGEAVELEVADSGPGLSDESRRRAFEPFYTTKQRGTGLGLAIVSRIADAHGGEVIAKNRPEGGAAFALRIPCPVKEAVA